jgi:hypothetical protein
MDSEERSLPTADPDKFRVELRTHIARCMRCTHVPTKPLCPEGDKLAAHRDEAALAVMEEAAHAAAVTHVQRARRKTIVNFRCGDLRGGIFYNHGRWEVIVGTVKNKVGRVTGRATCEADEITATIQQLITEETTDVRVVSGAGQHLPPRTSCP